MQIIKQKDVCFITYTLQKRSKGQKEDKEVDGVWGEGSRWGEKEKEEREGSHMGSTDSGSKFQTPIFTVTQKNYRFFLTKSMLCLHWPKRSRKVLILNA